MHLQLRNHLISLDKENEQRLLAIQTSIFALALDDRNPTTLTEVHLRPYSLLLGVDGYSEVIKLEGLKRILRADSEATKVEVIGVL